MVEVHRGEDQVQALDSEMLPGEVSGRELPSLSALGDGGGCCLQPWLVENHGTS